jgi:hypothetical protein
VYLDGKVAAADAPHVTPAPDAAIDARSIDATPDACIPQITELLANPVFDLTPQGMGWQQTAIDPTYPPITSDGVTAQTMPYKVWLGGFVATNIGSYATDIVYQDVVVPANTTKLELTGFYIVGTQETTTTSAYDTGNFDLLQTNGTPIEGILALSNLSVTGSAWVPVDHVFASGVAGQTVRLRMTSSNDFSNVTNFFLDTLSLKATHCP